MEKDRKNAKETGKVRYAVVGAGWIAQAAVLPAFRNAKKNSRLAAIVSDDEAKREKLSRKYGVKAYSYSQYDECLASGEIDAVYIALPNHLHREFTARAAKAGIHVLCEKPMAMTEAECVDMIKTCRNSSVKLMIAYRLHFEKANLKAVETIRSGRIGEPRAFNSFFSFQVGDPENIRLKDELGGGPLHDLGIYCINASRYLFGEEPIEVTAMADRGDDPRFAEVPEAVSAILRFPGGKLATFTCSFGSSSEAYFTVTGTKGSLCLDSAYDFESEIKRYVTIDGRTKVKQYEKRDQFAPELLHFSECILEDREPEPNGIEGLNDIRIITAIERSITEGRAVKIPPLVAKEKPGPEQERTEPAIREPRLVNAKNPEAA